MPLPGHEYRTSIFLLKGSWPGVRADFFLDFFNFFSLFGGQGPGQGPNGLHRNIYIRGPGRVVRGIFFWIFLVFLLLVGGQGPCQDPNIYFVVVSCIKVEPTDYNTLAH